MYRVMLITSRLTVEYFVLMYCQSYMAESLLIIICASLCSHLVICLLGLW